MLVVGGCLMPQNIALARMTVAALTERWPATIVVFNRHKMACVGCAVAPFYTVADAVRIYGMALPSFVTELEQAIAADFTADDTFH
jgi:hybrid cluster-associated redox disulfide protein